MNKIGRKKQKQRVNHLKMTSFLFRTYFEKLLTKSILALLDHKSIEPLKLMVEKEQETKSQFLDVVRRYDHWFVKLTVNLETQNCNWHNKQKRNVD